jgi:hypothetical protein
VPPQLKTKTANPSCVLDESLRPCGEKLAEKLRTNTKEVQLYFLKVLCLSEQVVTTASSA